MGLSYTLVDRPRYSDEHDAALILQGMQFTLGGFHGALELLGYVGGVQPALFRELLQNPRSTDSSRVIADIRDIIITLALDIDLPQLLNDLLVPLASLFGAVWCLCHLGNPRKIENIGELPIGG